MSGEKRDKDADAGVDSVHQASHVILDVEGTTTSISFVKDTLFPYVRQHLESYLISNWEDSEFEKDLILLREQAAKDEAEKVEGVVAIPPGKGGDVREAVLKNVLWQMDVDRKTKALKQLQGHVMREGYISGNLKGHLYDDVEPALRSWVRSDRHLYIYSSGSVEAQKLLFGHSEAGNLLQLFSGHFDTEVGAKTEASSYLNIVKNIGCKNDSVVFFTDIPKEARAAREAGLNVVLVCRPGNAPISEEDHLQFPVIKSFHDVVFEASAKRKRLSVDDELAAAPINNGPQHSGNSLSVNEDVAMDVESVDITQKVSNAKEDTSGNIIHSAQLITRDHENTEVNPVERLETTDVCPAKATDALEGESDAKHNVAPEVNTELPSNTLQVDTSKGNLSSIVVPTDSNVHDNACTLPDNRKDGNTLKVETAQVDEHSASGVQDQKPAETGKDKMSVDSDSGQNEPLSSAKDSSDAKQQILEKHVDPESKMDVQNESQENTEDSKKQKSDVELKTESELPGEQKVQEVAPENSKVSCSTADQVQKSSCEETPPVGDVAESNEQAVSNSGKCEDSAEENQTFHEMVSDVSKTDKDAAGNAKEENVCEESKTEESAAIGQMQDGSENIKIGRSAAEDKQACETVSKEAKTDDNVARNQQAHETITGKETDSAVGDQQAHEVVPEKAKTDDGATGDQQAHEDIPEKAKTDSAAGHQACGAVPEKAKTDDGAARDQPAQEAVPEKVKTDDGAARDQPAQEAVPEKAKTDDVAAEDQQAHGTAEQVKTEENAADKQAHKTIPEETKTEERAIENQKPLEMVPMESKTEHDTEDDQQKLQEQKTEDIVKEQNVDNMHFNHRVEEPMQCVSEDTSLHCQVQEQSSSKGDEAETGDAKVIADPEDTNGVPQVDESEPVPMDTSEVKSASDDKPISEESSAMDVSFSEDTSEATKVNAPEANCMSEGDAGSVSTKGPDNDRERLPEQVSENVTDKCKASDAKSLETKTEKVMSADTNSAEEVPTASC